MLLDDEILLYRIKPPITNLTLTRVKAFNDIGVYIHERFAGKLRVTLEESPQLLLQLVDTRHEIGSICNGEVSWTLDTVSHGVDAVVDSHGNLHRVEDL